MWPHAVWFLMGLMIMIMMINFCINLWKGKGNFNGHCIVITISRSGIISTSVWVSNNDTIFCLFAGIIEWLAIMKALHNWNLMNFKGLIGPDGLISHFWLLEHHRSAPWWHHQLKKSRRTWELKPPFRTGPKWCSEFEGKKEEYE